MSPLYHRSHYNSLLRMDRECENKLGGRAYLNGPKNQADASRVSCFPIRRQGRGMAQYHMVLFLLRSGKHGRTLHNRSR
jgi:hypothetical protein